MQSLSGISNYRYTSIVLFFICLVIVGITFSDTLSGLFSIWLIFDEGYGHGFLVLITSLYLTYRALVQMHYIPVSPNWYYAIPLILASVLTGLAVVVGIDLLQYVLLPPIILLAFALVAGTAQAKNILVPIGLLYFAIPIWDYLNNTLVEITSFVAQYLVQLSGITAFITGNSIFIPSGEIIIAAGCSGLRYFIIGFFLGVLSSYLDFISLKRQLLLIATVILLSLVANWVRVYGITLIAYYSEMQHPLVNDHEVLGWILFMSFMMPIFYLNNRFLPPLKSGINRGGIGQTSDMPLFQDQSRNILKISSAFFVLWFSVSTAPYTVYRSEETQGMTVEIRDILPLSINGWPETSYMPLRNGWQPQIKPPDNATIKKYGNEPDAVIVYQYLFVKKGIKNEILPYISNIHDRENWALKNTEKHDEYSLLTLENKTTQDDVLVAYRFDIGGLSTSSYLLAKLYQFIAVAKQQPYGLFTAATVTCRGNCDSAHSLLARFIDAR